MQFCTVYFQQLNGIFQQRSPAISSQHGLQLKVLVQHKKPCKRPSTFCLISRSREFKKNAGKNLRGEFYLDCSVRGALSVVTLAGSRVGWGRW